MRRRTFLTSTGMAAIAAGTGTGLLSTEVASAAGPVIWVSPDGDDSGPGSITEPLASLSGARNFIRKARQKRELTGRPVQVFLRGGVYHQKESLHFGPEDSGTDSGPVTYTPYRNEDVRIVGGPTFSGSVAVPVTNQQILARLPTASRDKVVQIDLGALGIEDLGEYRDIGYGRGSNPAPAELFVNGEPMSVASWPNKGDVPIGTVLDRGSKPSEGETDNRGATFKFADPALTRWALADQMYVSGYFCYAWAYDSIRVDTIDTTAQTIKLAAAHRYGVRSGYPWSTFRVSNLLEEIDQPGEYFIDHHTKIAYLYPTGPLANAKIQVSVQDTPLMSFIEASNIEVTGMTFECARGMGIYVEGGQNVKIAGNKFQNLGQVAVSVGKGATSPAYLGDPTPSRPASNIIGALQEMIFGNSVWNRNGGHGHQILSNDVRNTGTGGIFAGSGDRKSLTISNVVIANNDVQTFNRWLTTQAPGIWISGVGIIVEHNLVWGAPVRAMFVSGNKHTTRKNEFCDVVRNSDDVGAIGMYRDPSEFGNVFENNFMHDNGSNFAEHGTKSIYLDEATSGQIIRGNVFVRAGSDYAIKLHGGRHNQIENNIFVDMPGGVELTIWNSTTWQAELNSPDLKQKLLVNLDIRKPPYSTRYPTLATYMGADGLATPQPTNNNVVANNVAVGVSKLYSGPGTFGDNLTLGTDPGFIDPARLNYALAPNSVVYERLPNFQPIPFSEIGLVVDQYRTSTSRAIGSFKLLTPPAGSQGVDVTSPLTLAWTKAPGAYRYRVTISETSDFSAVIYDNTTVSTEVAVILLGAKTYYWKVEAQIGTFSIKAEPRLNDGGAARFTTAPGDPTGTSPLGSFTLAAPAHGAQGVDPLNPPLLQWLSADNAQTYRVQVAEAVEPLWSAIVVDERTTTTKLQIPSGVLKFGSKVYWWRVYAEAGPFSRPQEGAERAFRTLLQ